MGPLTVTTKTHSTDKVLYRGKENIHREIGLIIY